MPLNIPGCTRRSPATSAGGASTLSTSRHFAETTILDVGGYHYWDWFRARPRVVIVNLELPATRDPRFAWVQETRGSCPSATGRLSWRLNSVVEHIPGQENREAYAREIECARRAAA
ncbi:MAG: hypothetical protein R2748_19785 [Bryobacterales bacterium]